MKLLLAAITILIFSNAAVFAQSASRQDLVLTGTVLDVKPFKFDQRKGLTNEDPQPDDDLYDIELLLQLRNAGDTPLIAVLPTSFLGKISVIFLEPSESSLDVTSHSVTPYRFQRRQSDRYIRPVTRFELDSFLRSLLFPNSTPYESRFAVIAPSAYYEYRESLTVRTGYKIKNVEGELPRAVSDFPALKVNYFLSLKTMKDGADAFKVARKRWKKFGDLPLVEAGDYTVTSEVILNKLNN